MRNFDRRRGVILLSSSALIPVLAVSARVGMEEPLREPLLRLSAGDTVYAHAQVPFNERYTEALDGAQSLVGGALPEPDLPSGRRR